MSEPSTAMPEKLRDEVAAAASSHDANANPDQSTSKPIPEAPEGADRLKARQAAVASLIEELVYKIRSSVREHADWSAMRDACDVSAAVEAFVSEQIAPFREMDPASLAENDQLGDVITRAIWLSSQVPSWPRGVKALADKQGSTFSLAGSQSSTFQVSTSVALGEAEVHGVCAVLWLQRAIVDVDLGTATLSPECVSNLARTLPRRITSLSLAETDFVRRGKDLSGLEAVCTMLKRSGLSALSIASNALPSESAPMLIEAIRKSRTLTSLDTAGSFIKGESAKELAAAVLASETMEVFSGIPMADLRADKVEGVLDLKDKEPCAVEARVVGALIPGATRLTSVHLDGSLPLPVRRLSDEPGGEGNADDEDEDSKPIVDLQLPKGSLGVASAGVLGSVLARNVTLVTLNLSFNRLGAEGAGLVAEGLKENGSLSSLGLSWNRVGSDGAAVLADALAGNTCLTSLELASNELCGVNSFGQGKFTAEGIGKLADALSKCALRELDLGNNCLAGLNDRGMGTSTNEGMSRFERGLPGSHIVSLILDGNPLGSTATASLAAALEEHTCLQALSLADCQTTGKGKDLTGFSRLVTALRNQQKISLLNLDGNELGAEGSALLVPFLKAAPSGFESLHLERSSNRLDDATEEGLKEAIGRNVMLHLERARPSYDNVRRPKAVTISGDELLGMTNVAATPLSSEAMLTPSAPPLSSKSAKSSPNKGVRNRRGSTGSMA